MRLFFACLFWADSIFVLIFIFHNWQTVLLYFFAHDGCYEGCPIVKWLRKCNSDQKKIWFTDLLLVILFVVWPFINSKAQTKFVILKKESTYYRVPNTRIGPNNCVGGIFLKINKHVVGLNNSVGGFIFLIINKSVG